MINNIGTYSGFVDIGARKIGGFRGLAGPRRDFLITSARLFEEVR
jgi:hypothetical protein